MEAKTKNPLPEINPCPFCGYDAGLYMTFKYEYNIVVCARKTCGAKGPRRKTKHAAIKAWNRRKK